MYGQSLDSSSRTSRAACSRARNSSGDSLRLSTRLRSPRSLCWAAPRSSHIHAVSGTTQVEWSRPVPQVVSSRSARPRSAFSSRKAEGSMSLIVSLAASDTIRLMLPSAFLLENAERGRADLLETTWGTGRDHSTWVVPETAWMWDDLGAAQHRLRGLLSLVESRKLS